eukprot:GEMP01073769.1.p2 GENE.GEMP01073769.1~~GEMP01073769.1.p2  ORF type:complete len:105 (+),score=29.65 GEMP01073769.1:205-519(+)
MIGIRMLVIAATFSHAQALFAPRLRKNSGVDDNDASEKNVEDAKVRAHSTVTQTVTWGARFSPDVSAAFDPEYPGISGGAWDFSGTVQTQATPTSADPVVVPIG